MQVTEQLQNIVESHQTRCSNQWCRNEGRKISDTLFDTLGSNQITGMEYAGEHRLNPVSKWTRPVYEILHADGRKLRLAFTGLSSLQVLSKRGRSTHCRATELHDRLQAFVHREARDGNRPDPRVQPRASG